MQKLDVKKLIDLIEIHAAKNIADGSVGAASVAVTQDGQLLYKGFFGDMPQQNGENIGEKTLFRLASMSKPITAAAIGILWSRQKIGLDDPVEKFIPCFRDLHIRNLDESGKIVDFGPAKTKPTVRHLLTHSSGIGSDIVAEREWANFTQAQLATLETAMPVYAAAGAAFEPDTRELYSGVEGFDILARIVEVVADQPYDAFLRENLFTPCEMSDTTFAPTAEQWDRLILMHNQVDGKSVVGETEAGKIFGNIPVTHFSGGAGLAGTLPDYLHFAELLLHNGTYRGNHLIDEEYLAQFSRPQVPHLMPGSQCWGFGVRCIVDETYGTLPVGAYGWSGAYGTHFWIDPENRITAVYMKNSLYDGGAGARTAVELEKDVTAALAADNDIKLPTDTPTAPQQDQ